MQKNIRITVIAIVIIVITIILIYARQPSQDQQITPQQICDYNSSQTRHYISNDSSCIIHFICIRGSRPFKDQCGCGCEEIPISD